MALPPTPPALISPAILPQPTDNAALMADLRGEVFAGSVSVTDAGVVLPNNPCRYVMLANWNTDADTALSYTALSGDSLYENAGFEILFGFHGIYVAQIFPSQNTGLLPVNNTNKIHVRTRTGVTRNLYFAWFY